MNASATGYFFSSYFGAATGSLTNPSGLTALALDGQGNIWLTGYSDPRKLPFPNSIPVFGSTYIAELAADGSAVLNGITAPAGSAGQAIVLTPTGSPAALGSSGSLLLDLPAQPATLVAVENSAGVQVTGKVAPRSWFLSTE